MLSVSKNAKSHLKVATIEGWIFERSVARLRVSNEQEGTFKLFIDEPRKLDYKTNSNNKLILILQNSLMPKLEKPGLDYSEHFMLVSKDKIPVKEYLCFF